ncbi:MAG: hypothetical protein KBA75_09420 [Alphaproteobacteria bacterium]|nr:hypothetical protein [Alphaproteobacteria bacterium]
MSADRIDEEGSKRRIRDYDEPPIVQMWRLASNEPRYIPKQQAAEAAPDAKAQIDSRGLAFLQAMHGVAQREHPQGAHNVLAQADRLNVHGNRLAHFADLVDGDAKKGVALLQAASLAITVPVEQRGQYPGMVTSAGKPELEDFFKQKDTAQAKPKEAPAVRPIAVDGVIQAMAQRYAGFSSLAS